MGMVSGSKPFVHRPMKVLEPPAIVRETAKTGIHTGAHRKKYETNPISRKPIAINALRSVPRAEGKIGEGDTFPRAEARANRSSPN